MQNAPSLPNVRTREPLLPLAERASGACHRTAHGYHEVTHSPHTGGKCPAAIRALAADSGGLSRIPESLWAAAVEVAATCGISRTAKALRGNYNVLRKRVEQQVAAAPGGPERPAVATFLELAPPTRVGSCQCTLELEDDSGAKMRVHLQGTEAPDLAALSRSFWELRA